MLDNLRQASFLIGREERLRWVGLVVLAVVTSGFEILGALFVYILVGLVSDPGQAIELPIIGDAGSWFGDSGQTSVVIGLIVAMTLFFAFRGVLQVGSVYLQRRVAQNTGSRLAALLFARYLHWPYATHLRHNSSELTRNVHNSVQDLVFQVFIPMIRIISESMLTVGLLFLLVFVSPLATLLALVAVGSATLVVTLVVLPKLRRQGVATHEAQNSSLQAIQQGLHGIRDIKVLGVEPQFVAAYRRVRFRLGRATYLRDTLYEVPRTAIEFSLLCFILVFFAVSVVGEGGAQEAVPILGLFAYAGLRLQPSLQKIVAGINSLRFASAPLEAVHDDLVGPSPSPDGRPTHRLAFRHQIALNGVAFRYEGAATDALSDVSLTIGVGEQIGICGPTGGGKTTLVDIVTGLLEPSAGSVTVDGVDIRTHTPAWFLNLGVVSQMIFLTDDTLRANVALGVPRDQVDDDAVREAVSLAQLDEFVASLPRGLDTEVGERGVRISGGQRQRISIARALYRRPAVLVFDEGTSALDNEVEAEVMAAIDRLRGGHTVIVVAHRLSTVRRSDRIFLVEQGRITGEGSFEELRATNERFRALDLA